jgi:hypothetical protein
MVGMNFWAWDEKNLHSIAHAVRTAVAATMSVIIPRVMGMAEAYPARKVRDGDAPSVRAGLELHAERVPSPNERG